MTYCNYSASVLRCGSSINIFSKSKNLVCSIWWGSRRTFCKNCKTDILFFQKSSPILCILQTMLLYSYNEQEMFYQPVNFSRRMGCCICTRLCPHFNNENALIPYKSSSEPLGCMQTNKLYSSDNQGRLFENCWICDHWGRGSCTRAWPCWSFI